MHEFGSDPLAAEPGIWRWMDGELSLVAAEGLGPSGNGSISTVGALVAILSDGTVYFTATIGNDFIFSLLRSNPDGVIDIVLRPGDDAMIAGDGQPHIIDNFAFRFSAIGEDESAVLMFFADGTEGIFTVDLDGAAIPGDLDGDGVVGPADLAVLLGAWGDCPPAGDCPADLDGDGVVGAADLAFLLGNWS